MLVCSNCHHQTAVVSAADAPDRLFSNNLHRLKLSYIIVTKNSPRECSLNTLLSPRSRDKLLQKTLFGASITT